MEFLRLMKLKIFFFTLFFSFVSLFAATINWLPAFNLSSGNNGFNPQIATFQNEKAIAVWCETVDPSGPTFEIVARVYDGTQWGPLQILSQLSNTVMAPQIAINSITGEAFVAFSLDSIGSLTIQAVRFDGHNFQLPAIKINTTAEPRGNPSVSINTHGNALVVWNGFALGQEVVQAALYNGSWQSPINISSLPGSFANPKVAYNFSNDTAMALWEENQLIAFNTFDGTNWAIEQFLTSTSNASSPQVTVNSTNGQAFAVWEITDGVNQIIQGAVFDGSLWTLTDLSGDFSFSPQIEVNPNNGQAMAIWAKFNGSQNVIESAIFDGSNWQSPKQASVSDANDPQIVYYYAQNLVAGIWSQAVVESAVFENGLWGPKQNVSGANASTLDIAMDQTSATAFAIWNSDRIRGGLIQVSHGAFAGFGPQPPANLSITQLTNRFPTELDLINQLVWKASPTGGISHYNIYLFGSLIGQVMAHFPLQYKDHHKKSGVVYQYAVTAVDLAGNESAPLLISL